MLHNAGKVRLENREEDGKMQMSGKCVMRMVHGWYLPSVVSNGRLQNQRCFVYGFRSQTDLEEPH
jgi:hypothetical protein